MHCIAIAAAAMARAVAMTSLLRLGCRLTSAHPVSTFSPIATSHSVSLNWSRGEQFWHLRVPVLNVHIIRRQQQRLWRCMSSGGAHEDSGRIPARLVQKQKELDALPEYEDLDQPIPKISLEHVTMSFARSGGAGGQNVNKVNTKVDMRFKVMAADWLPERVKLKLLQTVGCVPL